MYNILLLSHGKLAEEFLSTSELFVGKQENIMALGLNESESREHFEKRIAEACQKLYGEDGILILTDLYGGTPSNAAILAAIKKYENLEILTGMNLGMLLEAIFNRHSKLKDVSHGLKETCVKGIVNIKETL